MAKKGIPQVDRFVGYDSFQQPIYIKGDSRIMKSSRGTTAIIRKRPKQSFVQKLFKSSAKLRTRKDTILRKEDKKRSRRGYTIISGKGSRSRGYPAVTFYADDPKEIEYIPSKYGKGLRKKDKKAQHALSKR